MTPRFGRATKFGGGGRLGAKSDTAGLKLGKPLLFLTSSGSRARAEPSFSLRGAERVEAKQSPSRGVQPTALPQVDRERGHVGLCSEGKEGEGVLLLKYGD